MTPVRRTGLTLVELMAAMLIVSLLTVCSMMVIRHLPRSDSRARKIQEASWLRDSIRDVVSADLESATAAMPVDGGFALKSNVLLNAATVERASRQGDVTYLVRQIGTRNCLLRRQKANMRTEGLVELVCPGIRSIVLEGLEPVDPTQPVVMQPIPVGVVITVNFDDETVEPLIWTYFRN